MTVLAVYQNGVLRPVQPLSLAEGETVEITLVRPNNSAAALAEEEAIQRIRSAKTLEEWIAAANAAPDEGEGYDLLQALEENRKFAGEYRLLFAQDIQEVSP